MMEARSLSFVRPRRTLIGCRVLWPMKDSRLCQYMVTNLKRSTHSVGICVSCMNLTIGQRQNHEPVQRRKSPNSSGN